MEVVKDKTKITIEDLLRSYPDGLTITEMMQKTGLARHTLLARLHNLEGANKVGVRQINMAKLHRWKHENEEKTGEKPSDVKVTEIKEENIKKPETKIKQADETPKEEINVAQIKKEVKEELRSGKITKKESLIKSQREPIKRAVEGIDKNKPIIKQKKEYVKTGIPGFDELIDEGIPKSTILLIAGGAGSGKTIFCSQIENYNAMKGKKCLYMSFEERVENLIEHMEAFGWNPEELIKKNLLRIQRFNPFDITRNVDALLAKQKGELLIEIDPVILPRDFEPDFIVLDSLSAVASAFTGQEVSYRIYIEQLFRFFEKIRATVFLITETEQIPKIFSKTGVEEFLADGVIILYNIKHGTIRENAIEVLKLRGIAHKKKIVSMKITDKGMVVNPEKEVVSDIEETI